jgi:hypothetical protein
LPYEWNANWGKVNADAKLRIKNLLGNFCFIRVFEDENIQKYKLKEI